MKASFKKRFLAYFLDITLVLVVLTILTPLVIDQDNYNKLNKELLAVGEKRFDKEITSTQYINRSASIFHQMDKERVLVSILNISCILIYFVIIPVYRNGQTYGKKLLKIKVVRNDDKVLTTNDLLFRNIFINGLGYMITCLAVVYFIPSYAYFVLSSILSFVQITLVFTSAFMILYRHDKKGLHDLWTKTQVVEI
ncbi:MAG: RDD family protein [Bacilli bacterium]|nr:RDD family protein [Bacilli bacterium]MDD4809296.1 RDD family protein [Bacilli bacterium]